METIKVNMSPNPLDVQTIHASQNDGEARQWGFELHNNGDVIDASEISDQLVFKAYKGGTEQILPENGSVPTTSPIIADIKYPQGELADQEFLYRESPTEEDGLAKLTRIKGNTLVFNQLIENGNFASTSKWFTQEGATQSVSNNVMTVTSSADRGFTVNVFNSIPAGHKCLVSGECKTASPNARAILVYCGSYSASSAQITLRSSSTNWERLTGIVTSAGNEVFQFRLYADSTTNQFRNVMLIDLTQMFGAGKEPTVEQFKSYFPLHYYSYQSTLLPFKGTGIKTVGKNLLDLKYSRPYYVGGTYVESGITSIYDNQTLKVSGTATATAFVNLTFYSNVSNAQDFTNLANKRVKMSAVELPSGTAISIQYFRSDGTYTGVGASLSPSQLIAEFTMPSDAVGLRSYLQINNGTTVDFTLKVMLTFADAEQTFEPYTSSTLSLPISTYFPSGMKDVPDYANGGKIYDEMTTNKATTAVGRVDLGTLPWTKNTNYNTVRFVTDANVIPLAKLPSANTEMANIKSRYNVFPTNDLINIARDGIALSSAGSISVRDSSYTSGTAEAFKTAMSGQYLYYELATPTETSFTTASLVTENTEIPLSNEDGVLIGKCTEQLSENPGFFNAKIKLSDADGECYSNKIQLHVERSPQ